MPNVLSVRRSLALALTLVNASVVLAQSPSPTVAASPNVRLLTIGGFLGQFDGFCEPPGAPYDLQLSGKVAKCHPAGPGGNLPGEGELASGDKAPWPAALGGLLGAETWLKTNAVVPGFEKMPPPRYLLIQGNNQTPDFADYVVGQQTGGPDTRVAPEPATTGRTTSTQTAVRQANNAQRRYEQAEQESLTFWDRMRKLSPGAIALGPEDFYRSLRLSSVMRQAIKTNPADNPAHQFVRWVVAQRASGLPLLASNAIVSTSSKKPLNDIEFKTPDGDYVLALDEKVSAGWLKELTLTHPCGRLETFTLEASRTGRDNSWRDVPITLVASPKSSVDCKSTVKVEKGALTPGAYFRLRRGVPQTGEVIATFRTHAALTPAGNVLERPAIASSLSAPILEGWPALLLPMNTVEDEMLVVSLVSKTTRSVLGNPVWEWKLPGAVTASEAPGGKQEPEACVSATHDVTCRIDFLPPIDALTAILEQVLTVRKRLPFIVLLSMMDDDDTLAVMKHFPEIRVVILPPDSELLGRAARETGSAKAGSLEARLEAQGMPATPLPDFSGDLGMLGVLDAHTSSVTRVIVRPEWVGETIGDVSMRVTYEQDAFETSRWAVQVPAGARTEVQTVPGVPLVSGPGTPDRGYRTVQYWPLDHPKLKTPRYITHLACEEADVRPMCAAFRKIWTDAPTLLAVTADALRERSHADIVIVPDGLADGDALAWMEHALAKGDTSWLSRYMLQRIAYRSYRFVRVTVAGDKLLGVLQKVLGDPLNNGSAYCIAGLGENIGCPSSLPKESEKIRINGRVLRPDLFYTLTLPDSLAENQQLAHSDDEEDGFDAFDALQSHLSPAESGRQPGEVGTWYPDDWTDADDAPPSLIARLEQEATEHTKHYINIAELEFGFAKVDAKAPGGGDSIPNNVDFDVRGTRSLTSRSLAFKIDSVAVDVKRQAVRGIFELEYTSRRELNNQLISYDRDRMLVGPRIDVWKVRRLGDMRPYVGYFWEGPVRTHQTEFSASRALASRTRDDGAMLTQSETAGFKTPFAVDRNIYRYAALGADLLVSSAPLRWIPRTELSLSRGKLEWDHGSASRVPLDLVVDPLGDNATGVNLATILAECPDKNQGTRSGDAGPLLNAFFTCRPDGLLPTSRLRVQNGRRGQDRTQLELEGVVAVKAFDRTFKATLMGQIRDYTVKRIDDDPEDLDLPIRRTYRFRAQFTVPLVWRLEFAPTYEFQNARIQSGDRFTVHRVDIRVKVPLFIGLGKRPFVQ